MGSSVSCATDFSSTGDIILDIRSEHCWKCKQPIVAGEAGIDELGFPVHKACESIRASTSEIVVDSVEDSTRKLPGTA